MKPRTLVIASLLAAILTFLLTGHYGIVVMIVIVFGLCALLFRGT